MTFAQRISEIDRVKFAFGKAKSLLKEFAAECGAFSMHTNRFGLDISHNLLPEQQLRAIFLRVMQAEGLFLFNISGVNLKKAKKGFDRFSDAEENGQITEWELNMILTNKDYLKNCIFHNGRVEFKKTILWRAVK
ncbi:MAG TPA: hypothetical protein VHD83_10000 [Puia sp.]|nr:hypothetical protein [Puia sp.]